MEDEENNGENAKFCKVILLGDKGVGKTSIISRFINDTFDYFETPLWSGEYWKEMIFKDYKNQVVKFDIWYSAGQERYRSLPKIFFKEVDIAILVYDITSKNSFEEVAYWYEQLKNNAPKNVVIGLAGNKSDLFDEKTVSEEKARNFSKEIGAIFKFTSARTSVGVLELFACLGCKFLDPNYKEDENKKPAVEKVEERNTPPTEVETKEQNNKDRQSIKLDKKISLKKKKKKCC